MKRMLKFAGATAVALGLLTGTAYAHYCTNVSKRDGAGNVGVLFADISSGDFTPVFEKSTVTVNPQGQVAGGFMDIAIDVNGDGTADFVLTDVFAHAGLPASALLAAGCGQAVETNVPAIEGVEICPPA